MSENRDYYKILLVSQSGKGKTYSFRNMNPENTGFINAENKPLPFKNNFKHYKKPLTVSDTKKALVDFNKDPQIEVIILDSLSTLFDNVLKEARDTKKGYDIWSYYNEEVGKILNFIKTINKEVIITAHYEWVQDEGGAKERRVKSKGKEWEGVLEKEFTIVLYADRKLDDNDNVIAWFDAALDSSSAKCPPYILGEKVYKIENDCNLLLQRINEFINN